MNIKDKIKEILEVKIQKPVGYQKIWDDCWDEAMDEIGEFDDEDEDEVYNEDEVSQLARELFKEKTGKNWDDLDLQEAGFTFTPKKGSGGRRYIPKYFTFEKSTRDKFPEMFKYYGDTLYVEPKVIIALGDLTRGRQSYDKTQNFSSLTKSLSEKIPQQVRLAIKKGAEGQKTINVAGKSMIPLNLKVSKDDNGDYIIKNPYQVMDQGVDESIELSERKNQATIYKMEGFLTTDTTKKNQAEILSDIRSIEGITIVSSEPVSLSSGHNNSSFESSLIIKIDPHPYIGKGGFNKEQVKKIVSEILRVEGVRRFKIKGNITKTTL